MRWLDSITDPLDLKIVKEAWCATVHGVTKRWTRLSDWTTTTLVLQTSCITEKFSDLAKSICKGRVKPRLEFIYLYQILGFFLHASLSMITFILIIVLTLNKPLQHPQHRLIGTIPHSTKDVSIFSCFRLILVPTVFSQSTKHIPHHSTYQSLLKWPVY